LHDLDDETPASEEANDAPDPPKAHPRHREPSGRAGRKPENGPEKVDQNVEPHNSSPTFDAPPSKIPQRREKMQEETRD
jgi:hypothetical protein